MADTFVKYHCNYCEEDINGLGIRCMECEDFDLCLQCFACGAQIGKHKPSHGYQFMDTGNFSVFPGHNSWSAREEVRLLDAIEQYGYGNWVDISKYIETKTAAEAKQKYITSYIDGNLGKRTWKPIQEKTKNFPLEKSIVEIGPLSPALGSSLPNQSISLEETAYLGYMFNRDDFEKEWDNEAESSIASLFIHPVDDDEVDMAFKLAQVDSYIRRLRERARRKRVVRDYNLAQEFYSKEKERNLNPNAVVKRKPKEEREVLNDKLRPFTQFHTAQEHKNLISSLVREKELKTRIRELMRYRRNGVEHVEECAEFEIARSRRERKKEIKKTGTSINQSAISTNSTSLMTNNLNKKLKEEEKIAKDFKSSRVAALDTGVGSWLNVSWNDTNSANQQIQGVQKAPEPQLESEDPPCRISNLPGYHLLSLAEKRLCSSLNLKPSNYISYKAFLLKDEGERKFLGSPSSSGQKPNQILDSRSRVKISNFLHGSGWITLSSLCSSY